jgi:uncharacterized membrane protein YheB (UPF0754 family)
MIEIKLIFLPIVGAIIGLITNWLAVSMLFHPKRKVLGVQGVIPKRKEDIAKRIGESSLVILPESLDKILNKIKKSGIFGEKTYQILINYLRSGVERKINKLDNDEIERLVIKTAKKELRFIVWIGGLIGFLIGCIQLIILLI